MIPKPRRSALTGIGVACLLAAACSPSTTVIGESAQAPVELEAVGQVTTTLITGAGLSEEAQTLFKSETDQIETIDHVATVQPPAGPIVLFHFQQTGAFCYHSFGEGTSSVSCTGNDQMSFGKPFLHRTSAQGSGEFHVWLSNAGDNAAFLLVETDTGMVFTSNVVNATGYVITGAGGGTPIEARLVDGSGVVIWSDEVRT